MRRIVIVGGSLAGHRSAQALRDLGYDGELTVVGSESHRPYDRFPLSKAFLARQTDRAGLVIEGLPADVTWRLGRTAVRLDLARRQVVLDDQTHLGFDGLVVASGARPTAVAQVEGVRGAFVLRTVEDAEELRAVLESGLRRVVVVGGGLIGAEVAATAVAGGHHTTMIDPSDLPTARAVGAPVAEHLQQLHRTAGVHVRCRTRVRGLDLRADAVSGVVLEDGTRLPADVVMMATGTRPNVEWLQGSGLTVAGGLHCGSTLHAVGAERVVGAGDVVSAPHQLLDGESCRVEHWASALDHADLAASNLLAGLDASRALDVPPTFGTTIHGARIRAVGFPQVADRSRVVWGSIESGQALVALGRGSRLAAVLSLNAHERLAPLVGQLRPGSLVDDLSMDVPSPVTGAGARHVQPATG
jgi:3-phenylpropionate/trans-cinnamate dioxygenase ferredoxin reductase component